MADAGGPKEVIAEPALTNIDLSASELFKASVSRSERDHLLHAIEELRAQAGTAAIGATYDRKGSPLKRAYEEVKKAKGDPPEGAKVLEHKLAIQKYSVLQRANRFALAQSYYGLVRLNAARVVQQRLDAIGLKVPFADVMALYRAEGDLAVPMSVSSVALALAPDSPIKPGSPNFDWSWVINFLADNHTYYIDKNKRLPYDGGYQAYINSVRAAVRDRQWMLGQVATGKMVANYDVLRWLRRAKEEALAVYLLLIGGLDFYCALGYEPDPSSSAVAQVFAYNFARNRATVGAKESFTELFAKGLGGFDRLTNVEPGLDGAFPEGLVATLRQPQTILQRHIVPIYPVDFVAMAITEALVRMEAGRRRPLICGGNAFQPPLPPKLGYLRYNGWDIFFILWVLDVLNAIVRNPKLRGRRTLTGKEKGAIARLNKALKRFRKDDSVWTVFDRWQDKKKAYTPRDIEGVRNRIYVRLAITSDAASSPDSFPGPKEQQLAQLLEEEGSLSTVLPLIDELGATDSGGETLWPDVEIAMFALTGVGGKPWMIGSPTGTSSQDGIQKHEEAFGLNALRYYYLSEGYGRAFSGS